MRYTFLLIIALCICLQSYAKTIIDIKVAYGENRSILVYTPNEGKFHFISRKFLKTDDKGELQINLDLNKPGLVYLFPQFEFIDDHWNGIPVYVEDNAHIKLFLEERDKEKPIKFSGDFSEINGRMSGFQREFYLDLNNREKLQNIHNNGSAQENWKLVNTMRKQELETIKSIPNITPAAYQTVEADINSFHIEIYNALMLTFGDTTINDLHAIKEDWVKAITENKVVDYITESGLSSIWSPSNLNFKRDYLFQINQEKFLAQIDGEANGPNQWKILSQILSPQELEAHIAYKLYMNMSKSQFDEVTLYLYQRFKTEFPNYPYLPDIAPKYEQQLEFLATPKNDVKISRDLFNTLAEVAKAINKEYIFIDVWATWCGPCIEEFANNENLKTFLKKHEDKIGILYLSYDENRTIDEIEKVVNYHELTGFHIIGSESIKAELSRKISTEGLMQLPSYTVMDKEGKIVKRKTSRPSQWNDLEKELLEIINQ